MFSSLFCAVRAPLEDFANEIMGLATDDGFMGFSYDSDDDGGSIGFISEYSTSYGLSTSDSSCDGRNSESESSSYLHYESTDDDRTRVINNVTQPEDEEEDEENLTHVGTVKWSSAGEPAPPEVAPTQRSRPMKSRNMRSLSAPATMKRLKRKRKKSLRGIFSRAKKVEAITNGKTETEGNVCEHELVSPETKHADTSNQLSKPGPNNAFDILLRFLIRATIKNIELDEIEN